MVYECATVFNPKTGITVNFLEFAPAGISSAVASQCRGGTDVPQMWGAKPCKRHGVAKQGYGEFKAIATGNA
jgi:hypothetical protein